MPTKLPRPCRNSLCSNTTNDKSGFCDKHKQKDYRTRDSRYNSKRWKLYITEYIAIYPVCSIRDCKNPSTEVDHKNIITPESMDYDFWNPGNHQALCKSCHSRKTAKEIKFGRGRVHTYENIYGRKR